MINKIKTRTPVLALILFVFTAGYSASAQVVVIPLGTDSPWTEVNSNVYYPGNVGIGLSNPSERLHVKSTSGLTSIFDGGDQMYVLFEENGDERGYVGSYQDPSVQGINDEDFEIGTSFGSNGSMHIVTGENDPRITITKTGNVGIGTLQPSVSVALEVAGKTLLTDTLNVSAPYSQYDPSSQYAPDIILRGTTATLDEGVISSDPDYAGSDIWLMSNDAVVIRLDQDNNEAGQFEIRNSANDTVFDVQEDGSVRQNGATIHASDERLKKDIEALPYGLAEILMLEPKAYNWKDKQQQYKSFGLIAQQVQPVIKEIVHTNNDAKQTLGLSYTELIPVMINAIQEQQAIIDQQDEKINNLMRLTEELISLNQKPN